MTENTKAEKLEALEKLSAIRRIPAGLNKLYELKGRGASTVTISELSLRMNFEDSVIQKDLVTFAAARPTDVGFRIDQLIQKLEAALAAIQPQDAVFVCSGLLGEILRAQKNFAGAGVNLLATFTMDEKKLTAEDEAKNFFPFEKMANLVPRLAPEIGLLCVPHKMAQEATDQLIHAGITKIWNWSGVTVTVPAHCAVYQEEILVPQTELIFSAN